MTTEETMKMIDSVCKKFCDTFGPNCGVLDTSCRLELCQSLLSRFTEPANRLLLSPDLLSDLQSIPAMFWRSRKVAVESFGDPEKLLFGYLEYMAPRYSRLRRTNSNPAPTSTNTNENTFGSLCVKFQATQTELTTDIMLTEYQSMDSEVTFDSTDSIYLEDTGLIVTAEAEGDYFEVIDTREYDYCSSEVERYDQEVVIESITYTDTAGNIHELEDITTDDEAIAVCEEIEACLRAGA